MIFVLPLYNNEDEVRRFINNELLTQAYSNIHIYIVVNGGGFLPENNEMVTVLHPGKNTGYLGALRYVVENINPGFDYITLCNTDLNLGNENFLSQYINLLDKSEFAVAGPRIVVSGSGSEQNPLYTNRLSKNKLQRLRLAYSNPLFYFAYHSLFYIKRLLFPERDVVGTIKNPYALHGSFITVSKQYFVRGGSLNYPVLLYGEELFFAEESLRIGLKNIFINALKITHYEHATTGTYNFRQVASMKDSVSFILRTYYPN